MNEPPVVIAVIAAWAVLGSLLAFLLWRRDRARRRELTAIIDRADANEPCSLPGCIEARIAIRNQADPRHPIESESR